MTHLCVVLMGVLLMTPPGVMLDRIMAVIDEDTVTQSELMIEARVALIYREGARGAEVPLDDAFLQTFLRDYLVNELLVAAQARRMATLEISDEEVARERLVMVQKMGSKKAYDAFLQRYDVDDERITEILVRHARNERYVARRLDGAEGDRVQAMRAWLKDLWMNTTIRLIGKSHELELCRAPGAC